MNHTLRRTYYMGSITVGSRSSPYVIHAPFLSSPYPSETGARMSVASRALRVPFAHATRKEWREMTSLVKGPNMTSRRNAEGTDQTVTKGLSSYPSSQGLVSQPYRRFPPSFHIDSLSVAYRSVPYLHLSIRAAGGSDRRERYAEGT